MEPEIRYCTTTDGLRIAYTVTGVGRPVVFCWDPIASHVLFEWSHPLIKVLLGELARSNTVIRFDPRCCGLSDRVLPQRALGPSWIPSWAWSITSVIRRNASAASLRGSNSKIGLAADQGVSHLHPLGNDDVADDRAADAAEVVQ